MTKIRLKHPITDTFGTLYEVQLHRPRKEDEQENVLPKRPRKACGEPTEAQKAHRQRFKLAVAYARAALTDPELRPQYEAMALEQGKLPRGVAITEYLKGIDRLAKK